MKNDLVSVEEASRLIESGAVLLIAGSEGSLARLPRGNWIGGTSVYFLTREGGLVDCERVFCTRITEARSCRIEILPPEDLSGLTTGQFPSGFTAILIPAFSRAHSVFALEAPRYEGVFDQPLLGWISGVHLDDLGTRKPKVFIGPTGEAHDEGAALLYVRLDAGTNADLDIVNLFRQGTEELVVFDTGGFTASTATVNGRTVDFAEYLMAKEIDTRLPLVANYAGALINVSIQSVSVEDREVRFYAPVVAGVEYRLARKLENYVEAFARYEDGAGAEGFSCNCILNYLHGELEGARTGTYCGPATFGEIAYILLNQTMVRLKIDGRGA
jgi:hypothetical protein